MSKSTKHAKPRKRICQQCGKSYQYDGGAGRNRVNYCTACTEHLRKSSGIEGQSYICTACGKKYEYYRNKRGSTEKCGKCIQRSSRMEKKSKLVEYLGGKCEKCGYCKCQNALEFHHVIRATKSFGITEKLDKSLDVLKKEADKCRLLCANCHREEHDK